MLLVMNFWYIREFRDSNEYTTFNILTVEQKTTSKPIQTQGLIKKKKRLRTRRSLIYAVLKIIRELKKNKATWDNKEDFHF